MHWFGNRIRNKCFVKRNLSKHIKSPTYNQKQTLQSRMRAKEECEPLCEIWLGCFISKGTNVLKPSSNGSKEATFFLWVESWLGGYFFGWIASTRASTSSLARWRTPGALTSSIEVFSSMSSFRPWVSLSWLCDFSVWETASISSFALSRRFGAFASFSSSIEYHNINF